MGHGAAQPHRGEHRRGHRRRRQRRAAAGHRRHGQHGGSARAGGWSWRDRHRGADQPPCARRDRCRGDPAADAQGQGRAGRRVPADRRSRPTRGGGDGDDPVRRTGRRDGAPRDRPRGGRGQPVLRAADGHRRGGRRQVPPDPRVRGPRLVRGTEPGPARPLPALRRRCHVLADPRDRPERRRHQRRGSAGGGARQDRTASLAASPATRTTRSPSPTGSPRPSGCPPRSSRGRSCSGGSASCSRRSPAIGRSWPSWTTSTSPRRPSWS